MAIYTGDNGNNTLSGTSMADLFYGNGGHDVEFGGAGSDTLYGGLGNDSLVGGSGDDLIYDQEGDGRLNGGLGNDLMSGGAGRDHFIFDVAKNGEVDRITDLDSLDKLLVDDADFYGASFLVRGGDDVEVRLYGHGGTVQQVIVDNATVDEVQDATLFY